MGEKSPLVHRKVMSLAFLAVATVICFDLIEEKLWSQHEQQ